MAIWLAVVILGVIEGITEFLPISSTGHLLIAQKWLAHQSDLFDIVIQCGAVLAVLPLFPDRCRQVLFKWREAETRDYVFKLLAAFFITGAAGVVLDKKGFKLREETTPIALALLIGGILFVVVERLIKNRTQTEKVSWAMAVLAGVGQLIAAIFPGSSRSGTTILLLLTSGLNRTAATEFSFLLGIPTMLAAGGLKIFKALRHPPGGQPEDWGMVALGFVVAALVSFVVVKWLIRYVQTHTFEIFGWYRIALAVILLALFR